MQESTDPIVTQTPASSDPINQNQQQTLSVEILAGADNDGSSISHLDSKLSMNASINTAETTLPMNMSDYSLNSSTHHDRGSPLSQLTIPEDINGPQTPEGHQQQVLPPSPHALNPSSAPQTPNSQTPKQPLSKAQSIRDRRRVMEAWHDEQKSKSIRSSASCSSSDRTTLSPFSPSSKKKKILNLGGSSRKNFFRKGNHKEEMARYGRMVDRILYAEKQASNRIRALSRTAENRDARQRTLAMRERAELKLRLSQMERARNYYNGLMASNTVEAVPMEILRTINDLPNYKPKPQMSLAEELEAYVKTIQMEDPEEAGYMFQEIRDWKDSGDLALPLGATAPDFSLVSSQDGLTVDSKSLRQQQWRIILVFYHDYDSDMCKMNLMALQQLHKTFEREGAKLIAIGFEEDTTDTAEETEVTFPLLADEVGILATKYGIIRGEELPILSTFIIDCDGTILWRYVNKDYTKRPDPMEILEALPERKSQKARKLFFRKHPSFKKK